MFVNRRCHELVVLALLSVAGCTGTGQVTLHIGFARQAQTSEEGLPGAVSSLRVEVRRASPQGELLDDSGCLKLGGDEQRRRLVLDLAAGQSVVLVVKAWERPVCDPAENPPWMGVSRRLTIVEQRKITVPVFVTRRGWRRNFAREELAPSLAFASATRLTDGRVLIAGGFESLEPVAGGWRLTAGNRAWLYDPGRGRLEAIGRLSESRAAHRALALSDGRVLLAGGAREMIIRYQPGVFFQVLAEGPPASIDLFEPDSASFSISYLPRDMERIDSAWAIDGTDRVYAVGGKTSLARSDEIWLGQWRSGYFQWSRQSQRLAFARRGAQALVWGERLLAAGGAQPGQAGLEASALSDLVFEAVTGCEFYAHLTGATFHAPGSEEAWLCGGLSADGLEEPVRFVLQIGRDGQGYRLELGKLIQARAYHAAQLTSPGLVLAGGLGEGFAWQKDLELQRRDGGESLFEDSLSCASLGIAAGELEEGTLLFAGGLGLGQSGQPVLCGALELFSP